MGAPLLSRAPDPSSRWRVATPRPGGASMTKSASVRGFRGSGGAARGVPAARVGARRGARADGRFGRLGPAPTAAIAVSRATTTGRRDRRRRAPGSTPSPTATSSSRAAATASSACGWTCPRRPRRGPAHAGRPGPRHRHVRLDGGRQDPGGARVGALARRAPGRRRHRCRSTCSATRRARWCRR